MVAIPFRKETESWVEGRNPWGRGALLLVLTFILFAYLRNPQHSSIFDALNLVVHEAGHMFFSWFGEFLQVAGGTIFELGIPLAVGFVFYRQRDFFGMSVVLFWLGTALFHVGVYVADTRTQLLQLFSIGAGDPLHDWYYLLGRAGLLEQDRVLGAGFRILGTLAMGAALAWGGWMVRLMAASAPGPQAHLPGDG